MFEYLIRCFITEKEINIRNIKQDHDRLKEQQLLENKKLKEQQDKLRYQEQERQQKIFREQQRLIEQKRIEDEKERILRENLRKKKLQEDNKLYDELSMKIDLYIRNQKNFNSKNPLNYKLCIKSINNYINLENNNDFSLIDFVNQPLTKFYDFDTKRERFIINNNNNNDVSLKYLTPFQGEKTHRVYGYFKCSACNNRWKSASTWTDKWQKCKKCDTMIYPYDQHILLNEHQEEKTTKSLIPHDMERCQKCIELKRICCPGKYYAN